MKPRPTTRAAQGRPPLGKGFTRLFAAVTLTGLGDGFTFMALPWLSTTLTGSAFLVSLVSTALRLPWLLFSLPFGVLIDRQPRHRLLALANGLRGAAVALLALAVARGWADLRLLLPVAFLFGTAKVLFESTAQAMVPTLVPRTRLERANGLIVTSRLITTDILGQALGGFLITLGLAVPFFLDAAAAALSVPLLLGLGAAVYRGKGGEGEKQPPAYNRGQGARPRFREDLLAGLRFVWQQPFLRGLALFAIGMTAPFSAVVGIQVLYMQENLGLNAAGFGLLIAVATGGSVLGSQSVAWLKEKLGMRRAMLLALGVMSMAYGLVGLSSHWAPVGVLYTLAAFFVVVWNVLNVSLRQRLVPDHLLGRVGSVFRFMSWGVSALGTAFGGALVSFSEWVVGREWALRTPYFLLAAVYAALFLWAQRLLREEYLLQEKPL